MIWLWLSFTICLSGGRIEKIVTPSEIFIHCTGNCESAVFIQKHAEEEDFSAIEACAGEDIVTCLGSAVTLSAASTHDPLGAKLKYHWFFYAKPWGSRVKLHCQDTMNPFFTPDISGEYYVTLEVEAEDGRTGADTVVVVAEDCKGYPIAVITTQTTVLRPGEVMLSAKESSCLNDEIVSYEWEVLEKPIDSRTTVSGCEEAYLLLDIVGRYRIRLTIHTMKGYTDSTEIDLNCIDGLIPSVYAYSQDFMVYGAMSGVKKTAVLIEFPNGTGDLTGLAVYGQNSEKTALIGTIDLDEEELCYSEVVDFFDQVYVAGMIDEKTVLVKFCDRY